MLISLRGLFFLNGLLFAVWAVSIPSVQRLLSVSDVGLSWLLFAIMLGNLLALPPATRLLRLAGLKVVMLSGMLMMVLGLASVPFVSAQVALFALLVYGIGFGFVDFGANAAGTWLGEKLSRPVISGLHAAFSIGTLFGGVIGLVLLPVGLVWALSGLGVALLLLGAFLASGLPSLTLPEHPISSAEEQPSRLGWKLGLLCFAGLSAALLEGSVSDWSSVFMQGVMNLTASQSGLGYTAFALSMVVGRLCGDVLTVKLGAVRLSILALGLCLVALTFLYLFSSPVMALLSFALVGLGVSVLTPLAFGVAWSRAGARGVSLMTAAVYGGFLAGPPLIGLLLSITQLRGVFVLPTLLMVITFVLGVLRVFSDRPAEDGEVA